MNAMQAVSVSLYYMRITERRKLDPLVVDNFDGAHDLLDIIHDALKEYQGNSVEIKGGSRRTYITNDLKRKGRIIDGSVEVGTSGYTASIKDVDTNEERFRQLPNQAAMIPLYFRFWVPKAEKFALASFQHYGDTGCKSSMDSILSGSFGRKFEEYTFAMRQVVPAQYAEQLIKSGALKELRFIQYGVGKDIANIYGGQSLPPGTANAEIRVVARNANTVPLTRWINEKLQRRPKVKVQQGSLELEPFKYDDFRMRVNINGKDKMLKMGEFIRMNSRMDVTQEVSIGADGHPTRKSISDICAALMAQITKEDAGITP